MTSRAPRDNSESTQKLLEDAKAGRQEAVEELLEQHRDGLIRAVRLRLDRNLSARVDASDIVQEVLIEASRRLPNYLEDPKMPFHVWLRHMARDQMIDAHRRHRGAQRRSMDREQPLVHGEDENGPIDWSQELADSGLTPATQAMRRELTRRFLGVLERLSEDDREIILLRHFEHLGNAEAAQILELTPAAAAMRYLRALRRVKTQLSKPHYPPPPDA
ncbi:ECF RNA polymerase sigma factor SigD [Planctomycetales bacterium 10988]|nr:ECF RNA polymerase sigma factor SigD [Planctomycetales bacterium 10988]